MDSGTDVTLTAITGTGYDNVWVSGWVNSNGDYRTVLLHFDGDSWRKVVEYQPTIVPFAKTDSLSGLIKGVFTNCIDKIMVATDYGLYICQYNTEGNGQLVPGSQYHYTSIMNEFTGNGNNDLFSGGAFSRIIHYNGSTFHDYEELYNIGYIYGMDVTESMVVAVGDFNATFRAMVIRGYR